MQDKYILMESITFYVIFLDFFVAVLSVTFFIMGEFVVVTSIVVVLVLCFNVFWFPYLKRSGAGAMTLPPNIFELKGVDEETLIEKFSIYFKTEWIEIHDNVDGKSWYMLSGAHRLISRVLLLKPNIFDKETFKRMKKSSNRVINRKKQFKQYVTFQEVYKMVRVNLIVMDTQNEYSLEILEQNAAYLYARAGGILDVFFFKDKGILCFPAHFINGISTYHKIYRVIKRFVKFVSFVEN